MKKRRDSSSVTDIEKLRPTVAEFVGDELGEEPLPVRLEDSWTDLVPPADQPNDPDAREKRRPAVPLLDDMKGILQWD